MVTRPWRVFVWILAYGALVLAIVGSLAEARRRTLAALDTPAAHADWQAWKAEAERAANRIGPVERRPPKSQEPPALILLRDHFAAVVLSSILIASCLYGFALLVFEGTRRSTKLPGASR